MLRLIVLFALLLASSSCDRGRSVSPGATHLTGHAVGIFTTLPLLWPERHSVRELLQPDDSPHWALAVLRAEGTVVPLDSLQDIGGASPPAPLHLLVLAQPRPLSPQENVTLDQWVRGGGRVLLFADPMLTAESEFPLGDKRRPQDVAMLSPILGHWGLRLEFDESQASGEQRVTTFAGAIPVTLGGRFTTAGSAGNCQLDGGGLIARCHIGRGYVVAVADADVLDRTASPGDRANILAKLLRAAAKTH